MRLPGYGVALIYAVSLGAQDPATPQPANGAAASAQDAASQQPEYAGPAILSRGAASVFRLPTRNLRFRPFLSVNGNYDSGITGVLLTNGAPPNDRSFGADITAGLTGYQRWKRSALGLNYSGNYRHYTSNTFYNGSDQFLTLGYSRQASRRVIFTLRNSAGTFVRNFNNFNFDAYGELDPTFTFTPQDELLDGRTYNLSTLGDLTFRKSARLSFNIAGDGFLVRRRSNALVGFTGYRARADMAYRTSRTSTIAVNYDFTHFEFTRAFGASDIHGVGIQFSKRIGRWWELSMLAGVARVETLGLARVSIDPVLAAILGQGFGVEAVYRINYAPNLNATLTRGFRNSSLSFSYQRGVSPGNGIFLTSRLTRAGVTYSYTGLRYWSLGVTGDYSSFGSLAQTIGNYNSYNGAFHASRSLTSNLYLTTAFGVRDLSIEGTQFSRRMYRATVGFTFSPGELPLSFW